MDFPDFPHTLQDGPQNDTHSILILHDLCKNSYDNETSCNNSTDCMWINNTVVNHFDNTTILPSHCTTKQIIR